jgi:hypothetical protein
LKEYFKAPQYDCIKNGDTNNHTNSLSHLPVDNCRSDEHSVVKLEPRFPDRPAFDLVAVVDPVSRGAQKIAPVLEVLRQVPSFSYL